MRIERVDTDALIAAIAERIDQAVDDVHQDAVRRAPKRTGRWARSIQRTELERDGDRLRAAVGSRLGTAPAHESGPRARPAITPAGKAWSERVRVRIQGVTVAGLPRRVVK